MKGDAVLGHDYEQTLIDIVRTLPPSRAEQLIDFARFLEGQILVEEISSEATKEEIEADNAQWDALLESEKGQSLLEKLAGEALVEHRALGLRDDDVILWFWIGPHDEYERMLGQA